MPRPPRGHCLPAAPGAHPAGCLCVQTLSKVCGGALLSILIPYATWVTPRLPGTPPLHPTSSPSPSHAIGQSQRHDKVRETTELGHLTPRPAFPSLPQAPDSFHVEPSRSTAESLSYRRLEGSRCGAHAGVGTKLLAPLQST